jgi:hypothetical protein
MPAGAWGRPPSGSRRRRSTVGGSVLVDDEHPQVRDRLAALAQPRHEARLAALGERPRGTAHQFRGDARHLVGPLLEHEPGEPDAAGHDQHHHRPEGQEDPPVEASHGVAPSGGVSR